MSISVAIEISHGLATIVTAETLPEGRVELLDVRRIPVEGVPEIAGEEPVKPRPPDIEELLNREIDSTLAVVNTSEIIYEPLDLPFSDRKKINQVAPLQVQDLLPFGIETFVLDNMVLGVPNGNGAHLITSLVPKRDVANTLLDCTRLGADPKTITSYGSAIACLPVLCGENLGSTFAILFGNASRLVLAIFARRVLASLREYELFEGGQSVEHVAADLRCSLSQISKESGTKIETVHVIGLPRAYERLKEQLQVPVKMLDLSQFVSQKKEVVESPNSIPWAIGLFSAQISLARKVKPTLSDFRRGEFTYKPGLKFLLTALRDEMFYVVLALLLGLTWVLTSFLSTEFLLSRVERAMSARMHEIFPDQAVPQRGEVEFIDGQIGQLEEQLRGLGSLSSLSPLESLKELSVAISRDLDLDIDGMNIGQSRISFQGSVSDFPAVGRLSSALEAQKGRFCNVVVDSKGKMPGTSRVRYTAELELCE